MNNAHIISRWGAIGVGNLAEKAGYRLARVAEVLPWDIFLCYNENLA